MHWQIQIGGGFHYFQADKLDRGLELANLHIRLLELQEEDELFAHFVAFRRLIITVGPPGLEPGTHRL